MEAFAGITGNVELVDSEMPKPWCVLAHNHAQL
jgi:hypothetical protein